MRRLLSILFVLAIAFPCTFAETYGNWLTCPDADATSHLWFRKELSIDGKPIEAQITVASCGYHELYVNGQKADERVLAPLQSRLDVRVLSVTYDVTSLLHTGDNTLALWTAPGWTIFKNYSKGGATPLWKMEGSIRLSADVQLEVVSDTTWMCRVSPSRHTGKMQWRDMGGECFDARLYQADWNLPHASLLGWRHAVRSQCKAKVSPQVGPETCILGRLTPVAVTDTLGGIRMDFGRNFAGWVKVSFDGLQEGDTIRLQMSDDYETLQDFGQTSCYVARGHDDTFCNRFNYISGRYLFVSGLRNAQNCTKAEGLILGNRLRRIGTFHCSDPLLNQIYETDLWTFRVNAIEGYVSDCPHRERIGYGEVAGAVSWGIALPNYDMRDFYRQNVISWIDAQQEDGRFMHSAPQMEGAGGVLWANGGMNIAWEAYRQYADTTLIGMIYEPARRWIHYLHNHVGEDSLLHNYHPHPMHFLGDWATAEGDKELGTTEAAMFFNQCAYIQALRTFVGMTYALDRDTSVVDTCLKYIATTRDAAIHHYYHPEIGAFSNGMQVPQAFALWIDIVPDSIKSKVEERFRHQLTTGQPYLGMGSSGLIPLFHYLTEHPEYANIVYHHLQQTTMPSYGYFITRGETAWPEYWTGDVPSRMHTCYTGVTALLQQMLAGIRPNRGRNPLDPASVSDSTWTIEPVQIEGLDFIEASVFDGTALRHSSWCK